jgi:AcrR family transcriptional regulator
MTKPTTQPAAPAVDAPPKRRRLTAEARKSSILEAARRAFTETGDMNGTTIKVIAGHSGISEGVIYRHFESKDQLFFEAVVEPLKEAVDELVAATEDVDRDQPLTAERQYETMAGLYRQLISTLRGRRPLRLPVRVAGHSASGPATKAEKPYRFLGFRSARAATSSTLARAPAARGDSSIRHEDIYT